MTDEGHIWFHYLSTAHVQTGKFEVEESYLHGRNSTPHISYTLDDDPGNYEPYPDSFAREWATFVTGTDALDTGYDPGSYGIGVGVHHRIITVPRVTPVHLLYYYSVSGTKEERILVQVPSTGDAEADLETTGILEAGLGRRTFYAQEYVETFAPQGFNRFGFLLPAGMSRSKASELHSFTGTFTDVAGDTETYTTYMEPMYINNDRPLFDFIYLQANVTAWDGTGSFGLNSNVAGIEGRLLRWRGEPVSENISPIHRAGDALTRDGYIYDNVGNTFQDPADVQLGIDGENYTNADAYNVRNYKRQ